MGVDGVSSASVQTAQSYLPEPTTSGTGLFKDIGNAAIGVGSSLLNATTGGVISEGLSGFNSEYINKQLEIQMEMQATSMVSNIEKSKHESKMAAIRNIRVG